jgi:hypothetical protein
MAALFQTKVTIKKRAIPIQNEGNLIPRFFLEHFSLKKKFKFPLKGQ